MIPEIQHRSIANPRRQIFGVSKTGEIAIELEKDFTNVSIRKAVSDLAKDGWLNKTADGYSANLAMYAKAALDDEPEPDEAETMPPPVKNFYEKDDD